jgi:hypothetical protein
LGKDLRGTGSSAGFNLYLGAGKLWLISARGKADIIRQRSSAKGQQASCILLRSRVN